MPLYGRNGHLLGDGSRLLGWCPGRTVATAHFYASTGKDRSRTPMAHPNPGFQIKVTTPWEVKTNTISVSSSTYDGWRDLDDESFGSCGKIELKRGGLDYYPGGGPYESVQDYKYGSAQYYYWYDVIFHCASWVKFETITPFSGDYPGYKPIIFMETHTGNVEATGDGITTLILTVQ